MFEVLKAKLEDEIQNGQYLSDIEKKAGLNRGTLGNIIYDKSKNPKLSTLIALAKALECSLDELVGNSPKKSPSHLKKLNFDPTLMADILKEMILYIRKMDITIDVDLFFELTREVYKHSIEHNEGKYNHAFLTWFMEQKFGCFPK